MHPNKYNSSSHASLKILLGIENLIIKGFCCLVGFCFVCVVGFVFVFLRGVGLVGKISCDFFF